MIRIHQVKCAGRPEIEAQILKKLKMPKKDLLSWKIHRESVDARGQKVLFSYIVDADVKNEKKYLKNRDVTPVPDESFHFEPKGSEPLNSRPIVAGFGPAGLFAALLLAQHGYRPIVVERGSEIDKRTQDVQTFWKEGKLNPESNVQFGMGGAGAFSDGKLTTRSKDVRNRHVYSELVRLGADPEIEIVQHPHIGTDGFVPVLKAAAAEIEKLGGTILFDTRLDDVLVKDGVLEGVVLSNGQKLPAQALIASVGHSAEDTLMMLVEKGAQAQAKSFAAGVRIEHLQSFINQAMLKDHAFDERLIPARYRLTCTASNGLGVYTFCMCPGGYVIPSSSRENSIVVNGMSYAAREGKNANAALLVQVPADQENPDVFAGMKMQRDLEDKAFAISGSYQAPVQLAEDFVKGQVSDHFGQVVPTYELGTVQADFNDLFSKEQADALKEALLQFDKTVPGFLKDAVLTGVETRSSSSIRLLRDKDSLQAEGLAGLYPCGEGAGYSGGIMTSAVDGMRCAIALMDTFDRPKESTLE